MPHGYIQDHSEPFRALFLPFFGIFVFAFLLLPPVAQAVESGQVGGDDAVVAITLKVRNTQFVTCTGVLIDPQFVLTAAHCLDQSLLDPIGTIDWITVKESDYGVYFGRGFEARFQNTPPRFMDEAKEIAQGSPQAAIKIFVKPGFDYWRNDLAILKLSRAVFGITPMRLPTESVKVGQELTSSGFGLSSEKGFSKPYGMKKMFRGLVANDLGDNVYNVVALQDATTRGIDSGSPAYDENRVVFGILSGPVWFPPSENHPETGGRFTDVFTSREWILKVMNQNRK